MKIPEIKVLSQKRMQSEQRNYSEKKFRVMKKILGEISNFQKSKNFPIIFLFLSENGQIKKFIG